MPGAGNEAKGEKKRAAVGNADHVHRTAGEKQNAARPRRRSTSWGAAQGKGCGPAGFSRQTAGVRKRPRRNQRINRRVKGGRSGSAAPRVRMKRPEFLAGFLFLSATSWAMLVMVTNGANAPHRTGRRRSRARPRFRITQRAGAYPCLRSPPGEQGSIPKQQTGSGMDPPVFWAGNTGKSQTTHSIIHPIPVLGTPKPALLHALPRQSFAAVPQNSNGRSGAVPGALLPPQCPR